MDALPIGVFALGPRVNLPNGCGNRELDVLEFEFSDEHPPTTTREIPSYSSIREKVRCFRMDLIALYVARQAVREEKH